MLYLGNQKVCFAIKKPSVEREVVNGVFSMPTNDIDIVMPDNAVSLSNYALYYAYYYATGVKSFKSNKLKTITGTNAMQYAFSRSSVVEADLSSVETIENSTNVMDNAFSNCFSLEVFDMSSLKTLAGLMNATCGYCTHLTTIKFDNLETISKANALQYTFRDCAYSGNIHFYKLSSIKVATPFVNMLRGASGATLYFESLNSSSFGTVTSQFNNIFVNGSNNTVHFPSNLENVISSWATAAKMSGTNTTILYDLPATE